MATVTTLNTAQMIVLPFATLVPVGIGTMGYFIWKRDKRRAVEESMTERMSIWFMASFAVVIGQAIFHVARNLMAYPDYRIGLVSYAVAFVVMMILSIHLEVLKITDDRDLLLNSRNEEADYVLMDHEAVQEEGANVNSSHVNLLRRRYIAALTYMVIIFQSSVDGFVLKYNPNIQDSWVQIGMFYVSKLLETIVVSTALIHAAIKARWYVIYMCQFTIAVGLSTLAAYDLVTPLLVVLIYEHPLFQIVLGISGGILLVLSYYFSHLEHRRDIVINSDAKPWLRSIAFSLAFSLSVLTGVFG